MNVQEPFSNLQLELLKLYSTNINDSELVEVKEILANYFAKKAIDEADQIWDKRRLQATDMDEWLQQ